MGLARCTARLQEVTQEVALLSLGAQEGRGLMPAEPVREEPPPGWQPHRKHM